MPDENPGDSDIENLLREIRVDFQQIGNGDFFEILANVGAQIHAAMEKGVSPALLVKLTKSVFQMALQEIKAKNFSGTVSLNVTAAEVGSKLFLYRLKKLCEEYDFPIKNLVLELLETVTLEELQNPIIAENIKRFSALGVKFALDDCNCRDDGETENLLELLQKKPYRSAITEIKLEIPKLTEYLKNQEISRFLENWLAAGKIIVLEKDGENFDKMKKLLDAENKYPNQILPQNFENGKKGNLPEKVAAA